MTKRQRRSFTPEFKAEAVQFCLAGDRSVSQVADDLDLTESSLRAWVREVESQPFLAGSSLTSTEQGAALVCVLRRVQLAVSPRERPKRVHRVRVGKASAVMHRRRAGRMLTVGGLVLSVAVGCGSGPDCLWSYRPTIIVNLEPQPDVLPRSGWFGSPYPRTPFDCGLGEPVRCLPDSLLVYVEDLRPASASRQLWLAAEWADGRTVSTTVALELNSEPPSCENAGFPEGVLQLPR